MNLGLARRAGAGLGLVGAMSGEVDMVISVVSAVAPYVKDGRRRALAVLDTKRVGSTPQVPTSAEAGLPQLVAVNWYVLLAPAATPRAIIERLHAESVKIMMTPETRETRERFAAIAARRPQARPSKPRSSCARSMRGGAS